LICSWLAGHKDGPSLHEGDAEITHTPDGVLQGEETRLSTVMNTWSKLRQDGEDTSQQLLVIGNKNHSPA
jgi:hypothetical protein